MKILNGQKERFKEKFGEPLTFTKFHQFIQKKKHFFSHGTFLIHLALAKFSRMQRGW